MKGYIKRFLDITTTLERRSIFLLGPLMSGKTNLIENEISINEEYTNLSLQKRLDCINRHLDMFNELYNQNLKAVANNVTKEVNSYDDIYGDENEESESLSKSNRTNGPGND